MVLSCNHTKLLERDGSTYLLQNAKSLQTKYSKNIGTDYSVF